MALDYPNTGMAVTIDIGEANDIHPKNKQDVGKRLALAAEKIAYQRNLVYSGPLFKAMKIKNDTVLLTFSHSGKGLVTRDGVAPVGFEIAGEDQKFHWAEARIINRNQIMVHSDRVPKPVAVRYAWQSNPDTNLYNQEGLPASPFRTDDWPGMTIDNAY